MTHLSEMRKDSPRAINCRLEIAVGDILLPGLDTLLLVVPILAILAVWIFGLDERIAKPGHTPKTRRSFCALDRDGASSLSDPDGKPWRQGLPLPH